MDGPMPSLPDTAEPALKAGDTLVGRYRLIRLLGEGGMGYVWEGRHLTTDKPVAIKALKGETAADAARLLREARLSASLTHRNVVQVFDFWEPEGAGPVFMVMELLLGETLGSYLQRVGRLSVDETRAVGLAVASAMRAAHAKGIVHRDLKPDNVFLTRTGDAGDGAPEIKVLDFGIARPTIVDAQLTSVTRTGSVIGTPHYMAPEQIYAEKDIDGRADVWALGAILYECLSGTKPFDGENFGQVFRKVTQGRVLPLIDVAPGVSPTMSALVMSMLAVDVQRRPTSSDVHDALDNLSERAATRAIQVTQWLPASEATARPRAAAAVIMGTPSRLPSPRTLDGKTPPGLAAAPSVAEPRPPITGTGPHPPKTAAIAIAGGVAALAAVTLGLFLASRTSDRHHGSIDFGAVPSASIASEAATAPAALPTESAQPAGSVQPVESPPAVSVRDSAAASAPVVVTPLASLGGSTRAVPLGSPVSKPNPKPSKAPPTGDPLNSSRF